MFLKDKNQLENTLLNLMTFYFIKPMNFGNVSVNLDATTLLVHKLAAILDNGANSFWKKSTETSIYFSN